MSTINGKTHRGFTLVELMITIVIVAILVSIAVPSYQSFTRKAKRSEAQKILLNWASNQEVWRSNNSTYADADDLPPPTGEYYTYTPSSADSYANTYTLTAIAKSGTSQAKDKEGDQDCQELTLNQSGAKTPARCWER